MSFIRTVLGDVDPQTLHACDAHEHVIIDPSFATENEPDFLLDDVERAVTELIELRSLGCDWVIDTMPGECGRNIEKLREVSRRSGVHIVAPTGVHLAKYYPRDAWVLTASESQLVKMMRVEIECEPSCGMIKIAGGRDRLNDFERRLFRAAAGAQRATGCPIITHTEAGTAVDAQIDTLLEHGAVAAKVTLSHTDRNPDVASHRRWLARGVNLEYDNHFRSRTDDTQRLIETLAPEFPNQLMVGMDAARRKYWKSYGGAPGLAYLMTTLKQSLQLDEALIERIYTLNARTAFSFIDRGKA